MGTIPLPITNQLPQYNPQLVADAIIDQSINNGPCAEEKSMTSDIIKTTKRNYLFTIQKRVGKNWQRITDAVFTKRSNAREATRELRNVTGADYRVRKMIVAS